MTAPTTAGVCSRCNSPLLSGRFCGKCGAPRDELHPEATAPAEIEGLAESVPPRRASSDPLLVAALVIASLAATAALVASFLPWFRLTETDDRDEIEATLWQATSVVDITVAVAFAVVLVLAPTVGILGRRSTLNVLLVCSLALLLGVVPFAVESVLVSSNDSFQASLAEILRGGGLEGTSMEALAGGVVFLAAAVAAVCAAAYLLVGDTRAAAQGPRSALTGRVGYWLLAAAAIAMPAVVALRDTDEFGWEAADATTVVAALVLAGALVCGVVGVIWPRLRALGAAGCFIGAAVASLALAWGVEGSASTMTVDTAIAIFALVPVAIAATTCVAVGVYPRFGTRRGDSAHRIPSPERTRIP